MTSCNLLQVRSNLTPEQQQNLVHDLARNATALAINEIYDNKESKLSKAQSLKDDIDTNVLQGILFNSDVAIDDNTLGLLMFKIPSEYNLYLLTATDLFFANFEIPDAGEIINENDWKLLIALFQGISDGCQMIIDLNS
jgi:hypothetical protein